MDENSLIPTDLRTVDMLIQQMPNPYQTAGSKQTLASLLLFRGLAAMKTVGCSITIRIH